MVLIFAAICRVLLITVISNIVVFVIIAILTTITSVVTHRLKYSEFIVYGDGTFTHAYHVLKKLVRNNTMNTCF